ncbi:hypothetical protein ACNQKP_02520 [Bdellovibrio bacteriovorus]|uniref:hypothetical protein n=1 Tax=Bdellovibrio bacteriovorus TaxID=959 RepID=UPI003AA92622
MSEDSQNETVDIDAPWYVKVPLKIGIWLSETGRADPMLRICFSAILWLVIIFVAQLLAYRNAQISLFELPPDLTLSRLGLFELVQASTVFPWHLFLAITGLVLLFPPVRWLGDLSNHYGKIKGRKWLSTVLHIVIFLLVSLTIPVYQRLFHSSLEYAMFVVISLSSFAAALYFLDLPFNIKRVKDIKQHRIGVYSFSVMFAIALLFFSGFTLNVAQSLKEQEIKFLSIICPSITLVSAKVGDGYRPGWLISRNDSFVLIRELSGDVYRTVDLSRSDVKEFSYLKRFGSNEERNRAFPACFDSL